MAMGKALDADTSKEIHELLGDTTVTSIKFYDTGARHFEHTSARIDFADGHDIVVVAGDERFEKLLEIVEELDLPQEFHDDFFVDLELPREWHIDWDVEVSASGTVQAYTEEEARIALLNVDVDDMHFSWDGADFRVSSVEDAGPAEPEVGSDSELSAARQRLMAAERDVDSAVRAVVTARVRKLYPDAATLVAEGEYNEDGLLHLHSQKVLTTDGTVLDGYDDDGVSMSEDWDTFSDEIDAMLDEIAERDDAYQGTHEFDVQD